MSEDAPDIFNCSICLENFKKPKLLPCQHTFCENCLDTYIQSSTGGGDKTLSSKWFLCPLCRQTVKPPDVNSKPREWASLMPINSMISSLMQTSEAGATVEESNESRNCGPCQRDEEISTGSFWCPNCLDFLCENCKKFHKKMKTLEMHKIIPVEEFDQEHTGSRHTNVAEIDEPCPDHVDESLKVFCLGHKTMCCVMCLTTHHNECTEIKSLEEMAKQMEGDQTGAKFIDSLDDMKTRLSETVLEKQEDVEHLNERHKYVMGQVTVLINQVKSNLDDFLTDFENEFSSLNEQQNEIVSGTKQMLECLLKTLDYGEQMLKYLSRNGPPKRLFIAIEKFKMQILNHLQQMKLESTDDKIVDYYFTVDEILLKLKTPMSVKSLAQVEPKFETSNKEIMPVIAELRSTCDHQTHKQRLLSTADISQLEVVKLWDVKGNGLISSGVFLHSGILVCCDTKNQTLNAYDSKGMFLCDLKLEYHPLTIDLVSEKEVVVLGHQRDQICTYNFNQKQFEQLQEIKIPYQAKGMTIIGNRIVITDGQNIDIMTVFGSKLQSITVEDFSAKDFCFIAADKSSIYYRFQGALVEISINGNDVAKKSIELPRKLGKQHNTGIAIDQYGNRYICAGNNLCILSKDGQNHCLFNTNIPTFAVGLQKNGSCFFVSNSKINEENIMLEVYEIHVQ